MKPETVTIGFEAGIPTSIDGQAMDGVELIGVLNVRAGAHGVGRIDMVEDRLVGIKSREIYEAPAAVTLHAARTALAQLTLDRQTLIDRETLEWALPKIGRVLRETG